jgi:hypothetical protein
VRVPTSLRLSPDGCALERDRVITLDHLESTRDRVRGDGRFPRAEGADEGIAPSIGHGDAAPPSDARVLRPRTRSEGGPASSSRRCRPSPSTFRTISRKRTNPAEEVVIASVTRTDPDAVENVV